MRAGGKRVANMPPISELPRGAESGQTAKRPSAAGEQIMTVEERLAKLEKSLRRWKLLSLGLLVATAALAGGMAHDFLGVRTALRTRHLVVVNERGTAAIDLDSTIEGDGIVSVHDSMNVPRALLGNSRKGFGTLELYSGAQQKLVSIGGSGSGGQIAVFNNSGRKVIDAQASKTNSGAIAVNDFDGNYAHGLFGDRR
jgi:hypothetical protein